MGSDLNNLSVVDKAEALFWILGRVLQDQDEGCSQRRRIRLGLH